MSILRLSVGGVSFRHSSYIAGHGPGIQVMTTNVKAVHTITLVMKSSMKLPLIKWSQVFKNPKWKLMIDAWFRKFEVSIYINIFLIFNLVNFCIFIN